MKTARCSSSVVAPLLAAALLAIVGCTDEYSASPDMSVSKDANNNVTGIDVGGTVSNTSSGNAVTGTVHVPVSNGNLGSPTYTASASYTVQDLGFTFNPSVSTDLSGSTLTLGVDYNTTFDNNPLTLQANVSYNTSTGATTGGISATLKF
jgi:hypothetical protein